MKDSLIKIYDETPINTTNLLFKDNQIICDFIDGAKIEIIGTKKAKYTIEFINQDTNIIEYTSNITTNNWSKTKKSYFVNWLIKVYEDDVFLDSHKFDATNQVVYIAIESKAIGDTIAWFPYVEEFRKKHNCILVVSTFHNNWFEATYPNIKFVEPGSFVDNIYAKYRIGWFYDDNKINYRLNRVDFKSLPLQQTASSILDLPGDDIKPILSVPNERTKIEGNYVVIAPHASTQAKYWNCPNGWQTVIDHLNKIGYKVVMISNEKLGEPIHDIKLGGTLENVIDLTGNKPMKERMVDIRDADLFIGLGSGLSWVSWALGTKTILISGFSTPNTEFSDCIRVFTNKPYTCNGCFNKHKLISGDWNWCPEHKDTPRHFECTKTIEPQIIIDEINKLLI
jgi:autotransporter strand-loop-strand O-heptosyltransferase